MNIKRIGLCVLALIVMGLSYWLAVGGNYDSKTVRIDPEEHTLVNSSDAIISKRILAMKSMDSKVYFLGYEGYGIYNLSDNTLRLMPVSFRGQHIEPPKTENYQRGLREITTVKAFSDFSSQEQSILKDLLESTDRGAHYYGDFYHSGYESSLIDMKDQYCGQHIEPPKTENYQRGLREITTVKAFSDFSSQEQSILKDLLESTDRGAHYYGDFYHSGYESSLIDMKDQYFITNTVRALKRVNHTLYVYDASGFIIIDLDNRRIQGFFNNRLGGEGPKGVPDSLRGHYGSDFTMIYALSKLDPKDLEILWSMRKQYLEKSPQVMENKDLFPLNLDEMTL